MSEKIDHQKIQDYSLEYSEALMERFFSANGGKDYVSGNDLLTFSEVKQVNFFILKALFSSWQSEIKRLKSPYFDYEHPESKKAMNDFMNVLSRNIKVGRRDLLPLTISSVQETLYLLLSPFEYFYADFSQSDGDIIDTKNLEKELKYVKVNKGLINGLIDQVNTEFGGTAAKESVITILEGLLSKEELIESPEPQLAHFSAVLPLKKGDIVLMETLVEEPEPVEEQAEEEPAPLEEPDLKEKTEILEKVFEEQAEAFNALAQNGLANEDTEEPEVDAEIIPEQINDIEEDLGILPLEDTKETEEAPKSLNDQFPVPETVLNDTLKKEETEPLAEVLDKQTNPETILNTMSINHGYLFINELFNGNADEFNLAMERIETCKNFDGAVELLVQKYARPFKWDMNSKEVKELLKVVFRRFR